MDFKQLKKSVVAAIFVEVAVKQWVISDMCPEVPSNIMRDTRTKFSNHVKAPHSTVSIQEILGCPSQIRQSNCLMRQFSDA